MLKLPETYQVRITELCQRIRKELWITGGWALSAALNRKYVGDVDVITIATKDEITSAAKSLSLVASQSTRGAVRIYFDDSNHLDVSSASSFSDKDTIVDALSRFNFSANSIAINPVTGDQIRTAENRHDLGNRFYRLNELYQFKKRDRVGNFVKADVLHHFFKLNPVNNKRTSNLKSARNLYLEKTVNANPKKLLTDIGAQVLRLIPPRRRGWLARGIVRTATLRTVTYWDDIDIIIDCDRNELFRFLNEGNVVYTLNFFGMPKVHLIDGQKADLITVTGVAGLKEMLRSFPLRPDAIAWSIDDGAYFDPFDVSNDLSTGVLKLSESFPENTTTADKRYAALKAVFLLARHKMSPDPEVDRLINVPFNFTFFDRRNATRLAMELLFHEINSKDLAKFCRAVGSTKSCALALIGNYMRAENED